MVGESLNFGIKLTHNNLDVTNKEQIRQVCGLYNPSAILCLSSLNLQQCEKDPFNAYKVNVLGVYALTLEALQRRIPIIIISSSAIFNGPPTKSFNEYDTPDPLNIYGQTKYLSEIIVQGFTQNHLIIRTGWLFGGKSSKKIGAIDRMIHNVQEDKEVFATTDHYGSPTYMLDFIKKLEELIQSDSKGIFHVINDGSASAAEFISEVVKYFNSQTKLKIISIKDHQNEKIKRSQSEILISKKINLRHWKEALKEYLDRFREESTV